MLHTLGVAAVGGAVCALAVAVYHGIAFGMAFLVP